MNSRHKDMNWTVPDVPAMDGASLCVLQDIRDEMKQLNRYARDIVSVVTCHNATDIPKILRRIDANTKKVRRVKK